MTACEFSLSHYAEILQQMKGRAGTVAERKEIILTHDVDIFPAYALETARLENDAGIKATYYVLLHSEWYNALSPENMQIWSEIKNLGHEIALHYDGNYDQDLELIQEAFCVMLGTESRNVSQHLVGITPDLKIPSYMIDRSELIKKHGYQYIADSGGWWRDGCICQHLDNNKSRLLAVLHPIWWVIGTEPFSETAVNAFNVTKRAMTKWQGLVNEHRKQQQQRLKLPVISK